MANEGALCLVTGATGYIGGRLVPELLAQGHRVRCAARSPERLRDHPWSGDVDVVRADLTDPEDARHALEGVDVAYYLIHALGSGHDFGETDRRAAETFAAAAKEAGVGRIVYLGGLAPAGAETVSEHLRSRGEVGRDPAGLGRADRGAAGRGGDRVRLGVVRDDALSHRAAAGDGRRRGGCARASSPSPYATRCATSPAAPPCRPR